MKQMVRLIGGPNHNEVREVDRDQPVVGAIKTEPVALVNLRNAVSLAHEVSIAKKTTYTRRIVRTPQGDISFFAPENWTDHEALLYVVGV